MSTTPDVSVVVLSHNRLALLPDVLASLERQTLTPREIIFVDNPSPASDAIAALVATHPGIRLVRASSNLGFAGGMNHGAALASGTYTYLTEDDLVLEPDCLEQLARALDAQPDAAIAAGVMRDRDDATLLYAGGTAELGATFRLAVPGRGTRDHPDAAGNPRDVGYIPTGSALIRTDVFKRLGGFRAEFFMYMEDVEFCLRVQRMGRRLLVVPAARVRHIRSVSTAPPDELPVHKWKNLIAVYLLHAPLATVGAFLARSVAPRLLRGGAPRERRHLLRALGWVARRAPGLLADRFAGRIERPLVSR